MVTSMVEFKYNLFHEMNMSNEIFLKIHINFLKKCDLNISRNIFLNLTCENVENISLFMIPMFL